ncbi:MAG: hypothetical protein LC620_04755, partial [Halobacteriales archaeon]|nr:hypothetical protein [Halobacteriales archaeon]
MDLAPLAGKSVAVLPDVYVDAICPLPAWPATRASLDALAKRGGGNVPVGPIQLKLGGNACNLAVALARLGATVHLLATADALGLHLLGQAAAGTRLRLDGVRAAPAGSTTLALECDGANLM